MNLCSWADRKIKVLRWYHISLVKLSVAAFTLLIAKLWPPLLNASWEVYLTIAVAAALPVLSRMLFTSDGDG